MAEHHLEFLSLKGGCTDLSEYTLVKIPYCWKSHVTAQTVIKCTATFAIDHYCKVWWRLSQQFSQSNTHILMDGQRAISWVGGIISAGA